MIRLQSRPGPVLMVLFTGPVYKILSSCVQYFGASRILFFPDTVFFKESILAHPFPIDYDVVWIVNVRHFPLAGQHEYAWQKPGRSNH
jgi:hypothetical protein